MEIVLGNEDLAAIARDYAEIKEGIQTIMATQQENQAKVDALADTLEKVVSEVRDLKLAYDSGQTLDFSRVDALVAEADEINADKPVVGPTPDGGDTETPAPEPSVDGEPTAPSSTDLPTPVDPVTGEPS